DFRALSPLECAVTRKSGGRSYDVEPVPCGRMMRKIQPAIGLAVLLGMTVATAPPAKAQEAMAPTQEDLAAITERGRLLYEYDQAAWHAGDAVQMANPKNVEGQRYIARSEEHTSELQSRFDLVCRLLLE